MQCVTMCIVQVQCTSSHIASAHSAMHIRSKMQVHIQTSQACIANIARIEIRNNTRKAKEAEARHRAGPGGVSGVEGCDGRQLRARAQGSFHVVPGSTVAAGVARNSGWKNGCFQDGEGVRGALGCSCCAIGLSERVLVCSGRARRVGSRESVLRARCECGGGRDRRRIWPKY